MLVGRAGPGRGRRQIAWAPALLWLVENHPRRSRSGASRRGSARGGYATTGPFRCCGIRGEGAPCGRQPGLVRRRRGLSQQSGAVALASYGSSLRATRPSNKGMKQTSVEHIGRSQLIPGVGPTMASASEQVADRRGGFRSRAVLGGLISAALACHVEPLPAVREPGLFAGPASCVPVPAPPLWLLDHPSDPRSCVPSRFNRHITAGFTVLDGRVADVRFFDSCTGMSTDVDASIGECVRASLATWRYLTWDGCPGQHFRAMDSKELYRVRPETGTPLRPSCDA